MNPVATITIEQAVSRFILKNEKSTDKYVSYLEHACDLIQGFKTYDSNQAALGLSTTAATYVPLFINDLISAYLLFKETEGNKELAEQSIVCEKRFLDEKRKVLNILNNISDT